MSVLADQRPFAIPLRIVSRHGEVPMLVRLTVKLAEVVNGLDLSHCAEGDVIDVTERDAAMLIAEGWAERTTERAVETCEPITVERDVAADTGTRQARHRKRLGSGLPVVQPS